MEENERGDRKGEKYMKHEVIQGYVTAEDVKDDGMLMFFLSRNEVEVCATYRMEQQIAELKKLGTDAKNIMAICFMGYDNAPREVYDIPAAQKYLSKLLENVPDLFYFIDIPSYTFAILVNSIFVTQAQVEKADKAILDYAKSIGDTGRVITIEYYATHQDELLKEANQ